MFNLLFIVVVVITVIVLIASIVNILRHRSKQTIVLLKQYVLGLAIYFGILVTVSLVSPQRVVEIKENRCFDDWCLAVEDVMLKEELGPVTNSIKPNGVFYVITLKLLNHARGRSQRAGSVAVHLIDGQGTVYDVSAQGQTAFESQQGTVPPLTSTIDVGQSVITYQVFDVPKNIRNINLTVEHPVGFSPGFFVIGDETSLFHKPTIVHLP